MYATENIYIFYAIIQSLLYLIIDKTSSLYRFLIILTLKWWVTGSDVISIFWFWFFYAIPLLITHANRCRAGVGCLSPSVCLSVLELFLSKCHTSITQQLCTLGPPNLPTKLFPMFSGYWGVGRVFALVCLYVCMFVHQKLTNAQNLETKHSRVVYFGMLFSMPWVLGLG